MVNRCPENSGISEWYGRKSSLRSRRLGQRPLGLAQLFLNNEFAANGLPSGVETSQLMLDSIVTGLHVNGVVGALLALGCVFLVRVGRRTAAAVV